MGGYSWPAKRKVNLTQAGAVATGDGVPAAALQEVTRKELPICVTLNRQHNLVIVRTSDPEAMESLGAEGRNDPRFRCRRSDY